MLHACFLILLIVVAGCGTRKDAPKVEKPPEKPAIIAKRVSDRPPNDDGVVFIVEYHRISKEEARWDRSISAFRRDLDRLHKLGFRPVSLTRYLDNKMDLPPGASPVVFTFDDSSESQLRFLAGGSLDPDCAVGIWSTFAKKHADFPVKATFFVLPPTPFGQSAFLKEKLGLLVQMGCELGTHTVTHRSLAKLSDEQVKAEIADSLDKIRGWGFSYNTIALPFGISPKNALLLKGFQRNGKGYWLRAALLVGANPAPSPRSPKTDLYRLPRIQAIEGDFGLTYWLDKVEKGEVKPYVAP